MAGRSLTEYRRYTLHGVFLVLVLAAFALAIGGSATDAARPVLSKASREPVFQSSAGYLRPAVVLATLPGAQVRHRVLAVSIPEPTADPNPQAEATPAATPEPKPAYVRYTIQPGDTISSIAASFGIDPNYILWNNPEVSADPDLLVVGENLLVPSFNALAYNVRQGDTLTDIASYYGIGVQSIVETNSLSSPDSLPEGAVLVLPGAVPPRPPIPAAVAAVGTTAPFPEPDQSAPAPAASIGYIWPWYGNITSTFDEWRGGGIHGAIDIDGFGSYGASVVAAASGQVVLTTWDDWGLGYYVVIQHDDGSQTLYAHLSDIYVVQGQYVGQGEAIGALGCTGYCTGTHLHFEIMIGGVPVDPLAYLP